MTIGAFARAGGVGVETVRYYQRRGLLPKPAETPGVRRYDGDELRRLRFIRAAQSAGFTLDEIAELMRLDATEDRSTVRKLAEGRLRALDARIAELSDARAALRRLAGRCAEGTEGPCPILAAFDGGRP